MRIYVAPITRLVLEQRIASTHKVAPAARLKMLKLSLAAGPNSKRTINRHQLQLNIQTDQLPNLEPLLGLDLKGISQVTEVLLTELTDSLQAFQGEARYLCNSVFHRLVPILLCLSQVLALAELPLFNFAEYVLGLKGCLVRFVFKLLSWHRYVLGPCVAHNFACCDLL